MIEKANVLVKLGRFEEAIKTCDEAIKLNPKSIEPILMKARVYGEVNNYEKVIALYDKVLEINPTFFEIHNIYNNFLFTIGVKFNFI